MQVDEWKARYIARLMACGLDKEFATADCEAGIEQWMTEDGTIDCDPEGAADDELSYMAEDGGENSDG